MGGVVGSSAPRRPRWQPLCVAVLPLLGALVAYSLTDTSGSGPFHLVHVAEAPPVEVAGARTAADLALELASISRLPPGAAFESLDAQGEIRAEGSASKFTTPDGITFWQASGALAPPSLPTPPTAPGSAPSTGATGREGVAGIADPEGSPPAAVALSYRPLTLPTAPGPAPRPVRAFIFSAAESQPLASFVSPLTVSVPFEAEDVSGWLQLAIYDPNEDAWVQLPVQATKEGLLSARTTRPGVIALFENRPPVAVPDAARTAPDSPVTVDVISNDTDPDDDPLGVFLPEPHSEAGGDVRCAQSGACTYTPPPGFTGTDSFTYGLGDLRTHPTGIRAWSNNTHYATVTIDVVP
jgi:hypothetical protein